MKPIKHNIRVLDPRRESGMTLLDILLAIVIFVVGMLALAHLQGNLSRSSGDSNARTVAANIGEEIIERVRMYEATELSGTDTCQTTYDGIMAQRIYQCLATPGDTKTITRGGINFTPSFTITDWYFAADGVTLTSTAPTGRTIPDFKEIVVDVAWTVPEFQVSEGTTSNLGSGSFSASGIVPSVPILGAAKIAADDDGARGTPPVEYTPGQLPDVIPVSLLDADGEKFKESETPMPDVIRSDYIVETWFDVITYSMGADASQYLRREEFAVVACECTLRDSAGGDGDGYLPTTWNGEVYVEGAWVSKQYGESANNQQSQYCDTCCRDHHDTSGNVDADTLYRPFSGSAHAHQVQSNQGNWGTASAGDDYLEVCRMVRKDGFMRVAQDFDINGLIATRQAFFTDTNNVTAYSTHVTDTVATEYLPGGNTTFGTLTVPGDDSGNAVPLPRADLSEFDQQVSRALYTDYLNTDLAAAVNCVKTNDASCAPPGVTSVMEILPFYEMQTTWLSFWQDNVDGSPVFITNETIDDDNSHSRGMAELKGSDQATVAAETYIHSGNNGLTSTDPIESNYDGQLLYRGLYIATNGGGGGGTTNPHGVSGSMSGSNGVKASDATFTGGTGVFCTSDANSFDCSYDGTVVLTPSFTISGYRKGDKDTYVCETSGNTDISYTQDATTGTATFDLSGVGASKITTLVLNFRTSGC